MTKQFSFFEEVIADEDFLAWHSGATTEGAKAWQQWLANNPQYGPLVAESIQYLDKIKLRDKVVGQPQTEAAHNRLMKAIEDKAAPVVKMQSNRKAWWMSAAAAVLLIAGAFAFWNNTKPELKIDTAYGQLAEYKLPDGSEVMLNANSKLSIKDEWEEGGDREVWLEGEAFFHVKKTTTKNRFIVHAKDMAIIVTGTQFNVVNRDGESNVLLTEGSVTIKTKAGKLIKMLPGDFVKINGDLPLKETAPEDKVLAWKQAKLVFENTPMIEVAKTISQHYGVKVTLDKVVEEKKILGILPNNNLEVLLKALEAAEGFQIVKKDKEIVISNSKQ